MFQIILISTVFVLFLQTMEWQTQSPFFKEYYEILNILVYTFSIKKKFLPHCGWPQLRRLETRL